MRGGLTFSFMAMGATVGGLTEAFTVYFHKGGRWTREDLVKHGVSFFGVRLARSHEQRAFRLQARLFGSGRSMGTLALKTSVDRFGRRLISCGINSCHFGQPFIYDLTAYPLRILCGIERRSRVSGQPGAAALGMVADPKLALVRNTVFAR